jgi:hypothetical protein
LHNGQRKRKQPFVTAQGIASVFSMSISMLIWFRMA